MALVNSGQMDSMVYAVTHTRSLHLAIMKQEVNTMVGVSPRQHIKRVTLLISMYTLLRITRETLGLEFARSMVSQRVMRLHSLPITAWISTF